MERISFELENIELTYLDKEILKIDRLAIHQFDRIGIVGKNGSGKSSLLKLLAGKIKPNKGIVHQHASYAYFEQMEAPDITLTGNEDPALLGKLHVPSQLDSISGGEQTRLKLTQLLSEYREALFIDEATTHLDQDGVAFIQSELEYYYGALVLVSHDRALLDQLVSTIWEIRDGSVFVFAGNYTEYEKQKQLDLDQQQEAHYQFVKEKSRLEKAAEQKRSKANKMMKGEKASVRAKEGVNRMFATKSKDATQKAMQKSAKAIEKRIDQLEEVASPESSRPINFYKSKALELHNKFPIIGDQLTLQVGDKVLLEKARFQFPLGENIAITGENGAGKSSLLQHIVQRGDALDISPKVTFGYFQQLSYQRNINETVLEFLQKRTEYEDGFLRSVLHSMYFSGNDLRKKLNQLSGGESIRLQLSYLFLGEFHILILDEPTNFLDIPTIQALENFFHAYPGTIVFVSHDHTFINHVAKRKFVINNKKLYEL